MDNLPLLEQKFMFNNYGRKAEETLQLVSGSGSWVADINGNKYLDFLGGLAVNALGHCHPRVVSAITEQAGKLIHTSNLYYTLPQAELASLLAEHSDLDRVFLCNSGTEANEAAIKLARRYFQQVLKQPRTEIITFQKSFHGRTLGALAATAQEKFHTGFAPLPGGFRYASFNNLEEVDAFMDDKVAAVLVEPIQGESGVYPAEKDFLQGLRELCDHYGSLLIFDEVQCGCGRTGSLFAYQHYGVQPDVVTLAKALGGGMPIGAMLAVEKLRDGFAPGSHGSTFGGNPVACAAAVAVWKQLTAAGFLPEVQGKARLLRRGLEELKNGYPRTVKEIRGAGMMLALELTGGAARLRLDLQQKGLLVNSIGESTLRLLPPLTVDEGEVELALQLLAASLAGEERK